MAGKGAVTQYQKAVKKRLEVSTVIIFVVIPIIIAARLFLFKRGWYLPLSLLMLAVIMAPFFMIFEKRKPKAREIVLIAMMSALTVVAHLFFHVVLPIQIGTALVIISGISLGPEAGFLIGALSRFVCNFYMGQGPWTPWQMFCWGLLGFLAGLAFNRNEINQTNSSSFKVVMGPVLAIAFSEVVAYLTFLIWTGKDHDFWGWRLYVFGAIGLLLGIVFQRKRLPVDGLTLALFTFFTTFVVYGGIMNFASMVTSINTPGSGGFNLNTLRLLYISGAPYDFLHASTAALCVFLFGGSIIKKLERIKIKYGIYK